MAGSTYIHAIMLAFSDIKSLRRDPQTASKTSQHLDQLLAEVEALTSKVPKLETHQLHPLLKTFGDLQSVLAKEAAVLAQSAESARQAQMALITQLLAPQQVRQPRAKAKVGPRFKRPAAQQATPPPPPPAPAPTPEQVYTYVPDYNHEGQGDLLYQCMQQVF